METPRWLDFAVFVSPEFTLLIKILRKSQNQTWTCIIVYVDIWYQFTVDIVLIVLCSNIVMLYVIGACTSIFVSVPYCHRYVCSIYMNSNVVSTHWYINKTEINLTDLWCHQNWDYLPIDCLQLFLHWVWSWSHLLGYGIQSNKNRNKYFRNKGYLDFCIICTSDSSNFLCRSHIRQYHWGHYKLEYLEVSMRVCWHYCDRSKCTCRRKPSLYVSTSNCSSHIGTALNETHIASQEELGCVLGGSRHQLGYWLIYPN